MTNNGTKAGPVTPPLLTPEMADACAVHVRSIRRLGNADPLVIALRALAEGRTVCVSVDGAVTSKTVPHELSVDASAVYLKDGGA